MSSTSSTSALPAIPPITADQATAAALADGIQQPEINAFILRDYGYVSPQPVAGVQAGQVVLPSEVQTALQNMNTESEQNGIVGAIASDVSTVLGWAKSAGLLALLSLALCVLMLGGWSTDKAQQGTKDQGESIVALNTQHVNFENAMIQYYQTNETARINGLYDAAIKNATVNGNIPANVASALATQRDRLMANMAQRMADMRTQQAQICTNATVAMAYNAGLLAYFQNQTNTFQQLEAAQGSILQFLQSYVTPAASSTSAAAAVVPVQ